MARTETNHCVLRGERFSADLWCRKGNAIIKRACNCGQRKGREVDLLQ